MASQPAKQTSNLTARREACPRRIDWPMVRWPDLMRCPLDLFVDLFAACRASMEVFSRLAPLDYRPVTSSQFHWAKTDTLKRTLTPHIHNREHWRCCPSQSQSQSHLFLFSIPLFSFLFLFSFYIFCLLSSFPLHVFYRFTLQSNPRTFLLFFFFSLPSLASLPKIQPPAHSLFSITKIKKFDTCWHQVRQQC